MTEMTKKSKCRMRARRVMRQYVAFPGMSQDMEEAIVDLITDLLHLAKHAGMNPTAISFRAQLHQKEEEAGCN